MPQKYANRVILILVVLVLAVYAIIPFPSLFDRSLPWGKKLALRPGIDMAGGTKLVYEIKAPEGGAEPNLAERVMDSLKKRVDPDGTRNLIWRPQSGNRLEIQMPLSANSEAAQKARVDFSAAQAAMDKTNVRRSDVIRAVEKLSSDARRERFAQLEMGSTKRGELLGALASAYDQVKAAEKAGNTMQQAEAELTYEKLKNQIEDTNLSASELQATLEGRADSRQKRLDEFRARAADFPARLAAIDQFVKGWDAYAGVKGQLDDAGELKRLLRGSGVLEFHILVQGPDLMSPEAQAMKERLKAGGKGVMPQANDEMRWYQVDRPEDAGNTNLVSYNDKQWVLAWTAPDKSMVNRPGQPQWALEAAFPSTTDMGIKAVGFRFDARGATDFAELTRNNLKKAMAVMLDDKVISTATIQSVISRSGIISRESGYADAEFKYLISTLNAGSLPARLADEPISEQTVGPQLGQDNLRRGLLSCVLGLVVIGIFLIGYYHLAGLVAFGAVLLDVVLILGTMAALNATFTLPGIAGIVLTICIAVDANVLIFERLREEQLRGLGVRLALRNAYDRAFSAIFDSNVTTAITAMILYGLGSEEVKGFGITLLFGMLSSMFTALFVTKTVFGLMVDRMHVKNFGSLPLTLPGLNKFLHPKVDWMGLFPYFAAFSVVSIVIGLVAFTVQLRERRIFDIEFASGTSVQFDLRKDKPMAIEEVRARIEEASKKNPDKLPAPSVVSLGTSNLEYEVVTPNPTAKDVKDVVIQAIGDNLSTERESHFDNENTPINVAMDKGAVVPITSGELSIPGLPPVDTTGFEGGVAMVLRNLNPMLTPAQIRERVERQRLVPQAGGKMVPYRDMDIRVAEAGPGELAKTAVLLVVDAKFPYDRDAGRWSDEVANPTWQLVNDAITTQAQMQKVTNFDAQVAGAAALKAILALVASTIVIMLYIWFRFGDMKFGSASALATLHDMLFMIGAIGVSHYVANTAIGNALLIEPFRMNLTMVAAILTVLGYSMNDTVVVFDRIREIRGKHGVVNRNIINDAINQTFSRTMLISLTSIVLVGIMYIFGGSGIHGFTFALLIGIIEGSYSSIAIASPWLLLGTKAQKEKASAPRGAAAATGTGKK